MHTGVLTQETLAQVLRGISQRRKQGFLEVRYSDRSVRILFHQGRIVEFLEQGINPAQEILKRFQEAELVDLGFTSVAGSYTELWKDLLEGTVLMADAGQEKLRSAVRHRVLDKLYSIDVNSEAFFTFDAAMVEVDKDFAPSVSVGQLLLDLVALQSDYEAFRQTFPSDCLIERKANKFSGLSEDEQQLLNVLDRPLTRAQLKTRSMLSDFAMQEGLMHLHSQGAVLVSVAPPTLSSDEFLDEHLLQGLDASIDAAFEEEGILEAARSLEVDESAIDEALEHPELALQRARPASAFRQRLTLLSSRMMHMHWIPALVMALFLLSTIAIPLLMWKETFRAFVD